MACCHEEELVLPDDHRRAPARSNTIGSESWERPFESTDLLAKYRDEQGPFLPHSSTLGDGCMTECVCIGKNIKLQVTLNRYNHRVYLFHVTDLSFFDSSSVNVRSMMPSGEPSTV